MVKAESAKQESAEDQEDKLTSEEIHNLMVDNEETKVIKDFPFLGSSLQLKAGTQLKAHFLFLVF